MEMTEGKKTWTIEQRSADGEFWYQVGDPYTDVDEAKDEYRRQQELNGHDTYFALIQRKVIWTG
jgi:hypothetical protein